MTKKNKCDHAFVDMLDQGGPLEKGCSRCARILMNHAFDDGDTTLRLMEVELESGPTYQVIANSFCLEIDVEIPTTDLATATGLFELLAKQGVFIR